MRLEEPGDDGVSGCLAQDEERKRQRREGARLRFFAWRQRVRAPTSGIAAGWALGAPGPDGPDEAGAICRLRKRGDLDHVAGVRGLDETPAADVDPLVLRAARARMEKEEVAGLQLPGQHGATLLELGSGVVGQANAELRVDIQRETGAVEAADRVGAAPAVGHAEELQGDPGRLRACCPTGRDTEQQRLLQAVVAAGGHAMAGDAERKPRQACRALRVGERCRRPSEPDEELRAGVDPERRVSRYKPQADHAAALSRTTASCSTTR